jgi:hypothetical protein
MTADVGHDLDLYVAMAAMKEIAEHEAEIRGVRSRRDEAMRRLHQAGWRPGRIARALDLSPSAVRNVVCPYGAPVAPAKVEPY